MGMQVIQGRKADGTYAPVRVDATGKLETAGGGEWSLISRVALTVATTVDGHGAANATINLVIPAGFTQLKLRARVLTDDAAGSTILMRFNNVNTTTYRSVRAEDGNAASKFNEAYLRGAAVGNALYAEYLIVNQPTQKKLMFGQVSGLVNPSTAIMTQVTGVWEDNTVAINNIGFYPNTLGTSLVWQPGTFFEVFGRA